MNASDLSETSPSDGKPTGIPRLRELSRTVAAVYLGIAVQVLYLGVERKQIPYLRVMGRDILKSGFEPFRATFKQEVGIAKTE